MQAARVVGTMSGMGEWESRFGNLNLGGLVASDGSWSYAFSHRDLRWAVPMVAGESRDRYDQFAELSCMANRLYWTRDLRIVRKDGYVLPMPHSFAELIRAYSSVINPAFQTIGSEEVRRRRAELSTAPPSYFDPHTINLVVGFMTGAIYEIGAFQGLVHFAECDFGRAEHGEPTMQISNCFWKAAGWPRDLLIVPTKPTGGSSIVAPLLVGAGLFALYLLLVKLTGSKALGLAAALPLLPP